jgi:predicted TIM-barrel fold metal-dependent hydrolase
VIIDAHVHVDEVPALGWSMPVGATIAHMDRTGIDRSVIMTITDAPAVNADALEMLADEVRIHRGRLVAYARIHPWYGDRAEALLEHALSDLGFRGLKLHPVTSLTHPGDESTLRLIRGAARHGAPTLFHCGDEPLTTPLEIEQAAMRCPEATIVLAHMGAYAHHEDAIAVAERNPNVVLETSGVPYPGVIAEAIDRLGAERVIWGSDGPGCRPELERRKLALVELSASQRRLVMGGSQQRLLDRVEP